jgi:hypothetical protein
MIHGAVISSSAVQILQQQQQQHRSSSGTYAAAAAGCCFPLSSLTMLRWVPQQQRLSQCAFVCRAWRTAAAAATVDIQTVPATTLQAAQRFHTWLLRHGGNLQALTQVPASAANRSRSH